MQKINIPTTFLLPKPSLLESLQPSSSSTSHPSDSQKYETSKCPSTVLSGDQCDKPSNVHNIVPSYIPTKAPSVLPTTFPFQYLSSVPSLKPSTSPTTDPSQDLSNKPSKIPTTAPYMKPSKDPRTVMSHVPSGIHPQHRILCQ